MLTDAQIAQSAVMEPITKVAESIGLDPEKLDLYGKYKANFRGNFSAKLKKAIRRVS